MGAATFNLFFQLLASISFRLSHFYFSSNDSLENKSFRWDFFPWDCSGLPMYWDVFGLSSCPNTLLYLVTSSQRKLKWQREQTQAGKDRQLCVCTPKTLTVSYTGNTKTAYNIHQSLFMGMSEYISKNWEGLMYLNRENHCLRQPGFLCCYPILHSTFCHNSFSQSFRKWATCSTLKKYNEKTNWTPNQWFLV